MTHVMIVLAGGFGLAIIMMLVLPWALPLFRYPLDWYEAYCEWVREWFE